MRAAEHAFQTSQARPRHFGEVQQAAAAWDKERRVIVKAGHTPIRLKRLKIGAVGLRRTRRSQRLVSRSHPYQRLFGQAAQALGSG